MGLLTRHEKDVLGTSLKRVYPVTDVAGFEHLLRALDDADLRRDSGPASYR